MTTSERCRELVITFRNLVEARYGIRWPELQPPASPAELEEVEQQLGLAVPSEVKALYGVCRSAGPLVSFTLAGPSHVCEETEGVRFVMDDLAEEGLLTSDPWDGTGRYWIGRHPPEGNYIVFGRSGNGSILIEADGRLQGRILFIDVSASGDYTWAALAPSVEAFLKLQVELVENDVYEFIQYGNSTTAHAHRDAGVIEDDDILVNMAAPDADSRPAEFEAFVAKVAAITSRYGGTQGMLLHDYDLPAPP